MNARRRRSAGCIAAALRVAWLPPTVRPRTRSHGPGAEVIDVVLSVAAFIVAIGVLVSVHEFGHFWVARRLGFKVIRFSVGFGRPLLRWRGREPGDTASPLSARRLPANASTRPAPAGQKIEMLM